MAITLSEAEQRGPVDGPENQRVGRGVSWLTRTDLGTGRATNTSVRNPRYRTAADAQHPAPGNPDAYPSIILFRRRRSAFSLMKPWASR